MRHIFGSLLASGLVRLALMSPAYADHDLRIPYPEDPKTADTQLNTDDYTIPLNIYDRLVEAVTTGPGQSALVPGLATNWNVSDDGKTYVFHLRHGVLFHDGAELTADDVVYTFGRMLDPKTNARSTTVLVLVV